MKKLLFLISAISVTAAVCYGYEVEERAAAQDAMLKKLNMTLERLYDTSELLDVVSRCAYHKDDMRLCMGDKKINIRHYINENYLNKFLK